MLAAKKIGNGRKIAERLSCILESMGEKPSVKSINKVINKKPEKPKITFFLALLAPKCSANISVQRNVDANKAVPKGMGSIKKENCTIFKS